MADIKTKDVVKGTIKKIDKAAIAADRMRSAYGAGGVPGRGEIPMRPFC